MHVLQTNFLSKQGNIPNQMFLNASSFETNYYYTYTSRFTFTNAQNLTVIVHTISTWNLSNPHNILVLEKIFPWLSQPQRMFQEFSVGGNYKINLFLLFRNCIACGYIIFSPQKLRPRSLIKPCLPLPYAPGKWPSGQEPGPYHPGPGTRASSDIFWANSIIISNWVFTEL